MYKYNICNNAILSPKYLVYFLDYLFSILVRCYNYRASGPGFPGPGFSGPGAPGFPFDSTGRGICISNKIRDTWDNK